MDQLKDFKIADCDRRILAKLEEFVPDKVFDTHAHLFDTAFLPNMAAEGTLFSECGTVADRDTYGRLQSPLYPGLKKLRLNVITVPDAAMVDRSNGYRTQSLEFLKEHLEKNPDDVGETFVLPDDTEEDIKGLLVHPNIRGFKCYHLAAAKKPTFQADIGEYLPESVWRVADERGFCITLHLVKDAALADQSNYRYIREMVTKYPSARLILAHCARGFAPWTVMEGIKYLSEFPDIYYDVSAVCEPAAICTVLKYAGAGRALWGSDFPVSMSRGKSISIGDSFVWIKQRDLKGHPVQEASEACLSGIEGLFALKQACEIMDLSRGDVEDIFYNNAMRLFGLSD